MPTSSPRLEVEVDLVAEMIAINPFDFFLEPEAECVPFSYCDFLQSELAPYLQTELVGPRLSEYLATIDRRERKTIDFLVELNGRLQRDIGYVIRMEPGVQTCEETLALGTGSCRDSARLMVQILRNLGMAARFVSGYLIQLVADQKPLEGPRRSRLPILPIFTPGARCTFPAPAGSVWTPPRACSPAKATSPWLARRTP